jgi:hypothetical protein
LKRAEARIPAHQSLIPRFAGYEVAVALSASALSIVLGLAAAPFLHKLWLAHNKDHIRQLNLAKSLEKAAKSAQQRTLAEHDNRKSRIVDWLTKQDLPRALPNLHSLPRVPPSIRVSAAADVIRSETDAPSNSNLKETSNMSMAMKVGSLPHSQWHERRGSTFMRQTSRDVSAQHSPVLPLRAPPSLPALPSLMPPRKTK